MHIVIINKNNAVFCNINLSAVLIESVIVDKRNNIAETIKSYSLNTSKLTNE